VNDSGVVKVGNVFLWTTFIQLPENDGRTSTSGVTSIYSL